MIIGLTAGAHSAQAQDWLQNRRPAPEHPTFFTTEYHGKNYPIMTASGERAQIIVDGKPKKLDQAARYQTPHANGYMPGYVEFEGQKASSTTVTMNLLDGGAQIGAPLAAGGDYQVFVTARESHPHCILAVIFFQRDEDRQPIPKSMALAFREIGDLVGGRRTKLKINGGYYVKPGEQFYCFPLVLSDGVEIRSNQSEAASQFFRIQEMALHAQLLASYKRQHPTDDLAATPYLRFPPQLPATVSIASLPPVVNLSFVVTEEGEVDDITVDTEGVDATVSKALKSALYGWLFLPCLKRGVPTQVSVTIPIGFGSASK